MVMWYVLKYYWHIPYAIAYGMLPNMSYIFCMCVCVFVCTLSIDGSYNAMIDVILNDNVVLFDLTLVLPTNNWVDLGQAVGSMFNIT